MQLASSLLALVLILVVGCTVDRAGFDPIDGCVRVTCDDLGRRCGIVDDGCGQPLDCGPCEDCIPDDCGSLGAQCGTIGDGCDMSLNCGECTEPETCLGNLCICQRTRCEDLAAECGEIDDGCGNEVKCGTCGTQERCNNDLLCECIPKDCDDLGAECGPIDNGCGSTINCGSCDGTGEVCLEDNECGCEKTICQSPDSCGLSWSECSQSVIGCTGACEGDRTCVDDMCQFVATNDLMINEFSTRYQFVEIFGKAHFDLQDYFVLGIEGDQEGNPGLIRVVIRLGATFGGLPLTLDEHGYGTYSIPTQGISDGSMTLLLVRAFSGGGIGPQDIDTNNDGIRDPAPPYEFLLDEVGVNDGGPGDRTYAGSTILRNTLGGRNQLVRGASRKRNGVDTQSSADWVRNAENGFGIVPDASVPDPGIAINTANGWTVYDQPGYNIVIGEPAEP